jgi:hypothetical protein
MVSILSIGFAGTRSWRTAQRQNEATAARLRLRVDGTRPATSARSARTVAASGFPDLRVVVRGEPGQVAAVGPQRVAGGADVGQVGEEVAGVPGERVLWVPKTCVTWADALGERSPVSSAGRAGLGPSGRAMIFGLWA